MNDIFKDKTLLITGGTGSFGNAVLNRFINSNYDLGYIFGTYLGDGHARLVINNNSESGNISWYFGKHEINICNKLTQSIKNILGIIPTIKEKKNILLVTLYNKCLTNVLIQFGKRTNKHLINEYYCTNINYTPIY